MGPVFLVLVTLVSMALVFLYVSLHLHFCTSSLANFSNQIGKLALYTAAAGIHPEKTLPIVIDCGTANETNLHDPLYLGLRQKRPSPKVALEFMDEFMAAVKEVYPNMLVQFEDFETEKAFHYLERYKMEKMFNDDIQGTGAVVLAG